MKSIRSLILLLLVCSCNNSISYYPSEKENLSNEITAKVAKCISNESQLIPCGTGGRISDQVQMLALSFDYHEPLDIDSGRELLVYALEKFRSEINADERIRPFLGKYPFEPKNVQIRIFIHKKNGSHFGTDQLCVIAAIDGILEYYIDDLSTPLFSRVHSETYEEASNHRCLLRRHR